MSTAPLPWGLTEGEALVIRSVIEHGRLKLVARAMGIAERTVIFHLDNGRQKAGVATTAQLAVQFDRAMRAAT